MASRPFRIAAFFGPAVAFCALGAIGGGALWFVGLGFAYWVIGWRRGEKGEPTSFGSCLKCALGLPFVAPWLLFTWALFAPDSRGDYYIIDDDRIMFLAQGLSETFVMFTVLAVLIYAPLMSSGWKAGIRHWSKDNGGIATPEMATGKTPRRKIWPVVLFTVVALWTFANLLLLLPFFLGK